MLKQLFTITAHKSAPIACALLLFLSGFTMAPASADDVNATVKPTCVDWKRLNLTAQQTQQIDQLTQEWNSKYMRIQPQIISLQRKIKTRFADPNSDPLEIMATQQSLARLQEELRNEAMANYLRKRSLLTEVQQRQLETMMQQMVAERQQRCMPQSNQPDEQNGFMSIIHKVRWAIEPH